MRILVAGLAALCAAPALAETPAAPEVYACRMVQGCSAGGTCDDMGDSGPVLQVTIEPGGKAIVDDGRQSYEMSALVELGVGRNWLLEAPGQGIGLVTLSPDNTIMVGTGHELRNGTLGTSSMRAECTPGNG